MINASLQHFCNHVVLTGAVTGADVRTLMRDILPDGIASREEADMLIALERAVPKVDPEFGDFLIPAVVDFAVWGERPSGYVDREVAAWLSASLAGRDGPTPVGARIAMEVVREAHGSAEALMIFALEANRWTREPARPVRPPFALAA
ncbi:hypothetical protein [Methylobacterium trifolii]|uniref:DUF2267 domain-containing protein n=1 Tax=Methylobacterium trifolii TaxID=1003092 RepID=A0ABQ4TZ56_9HYPH|nr:hypothetical protein [Methylobacterium trifolii]GJE59839.1 hypothetical protein MPOCJGCO_1941 [Methylobacterium trifolii]